LLALLGAHHILHISRIRVNRIVTACLVEHVTALVPAANMLLLWYQQPTCYCSGTSSQHVTALVPAANMLLLWYQQPTLILNPVPHGLYRFQLFRALFRITQQHYRLFFAILFLFPLLLILYCFCVTVQVSFISLSDSSPLCSMYTNKE